MDLRQIEGFEGEYSISACGNVWSHKRKKLMKQQALLSGYKRVGLRKPGGFRRIYLVHRLVASAFIPNTFNKPEVHHLNNKRDDNRVENLAWVSREENNQAAWDSGNKKFILTDKFLAARRKRLEVVLAT